MTNVVSSALALIVACTAVPAFGRSISSSELVIGGITIGQNERTVIHRLGAPMSRADSDEGSTLTYAGLQVEVGAGDFGVYGVVSTNAKYCTPSKLCPGMSEAQLQRLYGKPVIAERETGRFLEYQPTGSNCWLQVSAPKGIVKSLRVACQP
jgi:hypothetical protein